MSTQLVIPDRLRSAIRFLRGEREGDQWLAALPRRIAYYASHWSLEPEAIATGGAMSCCVYATSANAQERVLKIPVDAATGRREAAAVGRWAVSGSSPGVVATDPASGVYLMERIRPGTMDIPTGDRAESAYYCDLLGRMQVAELPPLRQHVKSITAVTHTRLNWARDRFADPAYEDMEAQRLRALSVLTELGDCEPWRVLHADLQPKNILHGIGGRLMAIDPLLARGDLNAEAALWAVVQDHAVPIAVRLDELAEAPPLDRDRLDRWAYVFAIAEFRLGTGLRAKRMQEHFHASR